MPLRRPARSCPSRANVGSACGEGPASEHAANVAPARVEPALQVRSSGSDCSTTPGQYPARPDQNQCCTATDNHSPTELHRNHQQHHRGRHMLDPFRDHAAQCRQGSEPRYSQPASLTSCASLRRGFLNRAASVCAFRHSASPDVSCFTSLPQHLSAYSALRTTTANPTERWGRKAAGLPPIGARQPGYRSGSSC
jgi:hypothetical protein